MKKDEELEKARANACDPSRTTDFAQVLTPEQMTVSTLITMLYIPFMATIAALTKEFGWKKVLFVTVFEIILQSLSVVTLRLLVLTKIW